MTCENYTVGYLFELTKAAPPRHQQKETEVPKGKQLRNTLCDVLTKHCAPHTRRLDPEITQYKEHENKGTVQIFVP